MRATLAYVWGAHDVSLGRASPYGQLDVINCGLLAQGCKVTKLRGNLMERCLRIGLGQAHQPQLWGPTKVQTPHLACILASQLWSV
jgi:hypothetical protein